MGKVLLIGEIGLNHNADMDIARKLITTAAKAGWDAVKFQKRTIDVVYSQEFLDSPRESPWGTTQRAQKEGLELSIEQLSELYDYARSLGLEPFASAWDTQSFDEINALKPKYHKVASPFLTNQAFLSRVAHAGKHTFISTGMSDLFDVSRAVRIFQDNACPFTLLHCVSVYPCPEELCNVLAVKTLREYYQCPIGYSGHEAGILPSVVAAVLGATAIERHITLDRSMYGSDQAASLEPRGMELLASYVRAIPNVLGDGLKHMLPQERESARKLRYWEDA